MSKATQRPHKARYTPEEIDRILRVYDASSLGLTQFATQQHIAVSTFHSWLCRRRDQASRDKQPPALIPVTVRPSPAVSADPGRIEVTLVNGRELRVPLGTDATRLGDLVAALES